MYSSVYLQLFGWKFPFNIRCTNTKTTQKPHKKRKLPLLVYAVVVCWHILLTIHLVRLALWWEFKAYWIFVCLFLNILFFLSWHEGDFLNTVRYMAAFESINTPNSLTGLLLCCIRNLSCSQSLVSVLSGACSSLLFTKILWVAPLSTCLLSQLCETDEAIGPLVILI